MELDNGHRGGKGEVHKYIPIYVWLPWQQGGPYTTAYIRKLGTLVRGEGEVPAGDYI